jgi:hypothetical protein
MGDVHDGVNFMRASCVIAVEKAKASFEPMLGNLLLGCSVISLSFIICKLTLLLMPLAGLHFYRIKFCDTPRCNLF